MVLAIARLESGRFQDAANALGRWAELTGHDPAKISRLADAAAVYARSGSPQPLPADFDLERTVPAFSVPSLCMALGQQERALDALERGYERGSFSTIIAILGPLFDRIRPDPRVRALYDKIGLGSRNASQR
jgi:hypothetical protein